MGVEVGGAFDATGLGLIGGPLGLVGRAADDGRAMSVAGLVPVDSWGLLVIAGDDEGAVPVGGVVPVDGLRALAVAGFAADGGVLGGVRPVDNPG